LAVVLVRCQQKRKGIEEVLATTSGDSRLDCAGIDFFHSVVKTEKVQGVGHVRPSAGFTRTGTTSLLLPGLAGVGGGPSFRV
jgi:hypothetical protein